MKRKIQEKSKITFFNINSCGYYTGGSKPKRLFGDIDDILSQLATWSDKKTLLQTQTFQESTDADFLPVFLYDIQKHKDCWLITLWNQTPSSDNAVASVMANGSVGSATVHMNDIVPGSIPGFATYFWFIPSRNVFANIKFQHPISGHAQMRAYVKGFIERSSKHVVYAADQPQAMSNGPDIVIDGYRKDIKSKIHTDLYPRFSTSAYTKPGDFVMLIKNAPKITKVCHRTTLQLQVADDIDIWQKMWRRIKGSARPTQSDAIEIEYDIKTMVSEAEVKDIIDQWNNSNDKPSWDDYGFQIKGDSSTHWLSRTYARDDFELSIIRKNAEIVDGLSLIEELHASSGKILKLLE